MVVWWMILRGGRRDGVSEIGGIGGGMVRLMVGDIWVVKGLWDRMGEF